ncbi:MAG: hypothetical protein AABY00_03090 [Nanoarchaeota archaeon]
MELTVYNSIPFVIHTLDYTTVYPSYSLPGFSEKDTSSGVLPLDGLVPHLRGQLLSRRFHALGILETRYACFPTHSLLCQPENYSSHYFLIDGGTREILPYLQVAAKGSRGDSPRAWLTFEAYIGLLSIPVVSVALPEDFQSECILFEEEYRIPTINLTYLEDLAAVAHDYRLHLQSPGFDAFHEQMSIEEVLEAADFYKNGYY